jgi:gamma-glutamyltranspeptidase/glutathione hydrolase
MKTLLLFSFLFFLTSFFVTQSNTSTTSKHAMVVSAKVEASKIGLDILKKGGNAFDAMVATELALAVAYPCAGNIGGGGFMVYRKANGEVGSLDYREKASMNAHRDMYLDSSGNVIPSKSLLGGLAVGVPGTIAGIFEVHRKFGTLPMHDLIQPAIDLARNGLRISKHEAGRLASYRALFQQVNKEDILFAQTWRHKQLLIQEKLAHTLERIQKNGRDEFYKGETAKKIVSFLQQNGGIISLEDLATYEVKWRKPIQFYYHNLKITTMAPPSSGGICLGQILKMLEAYDIKSLGHNTPAMIQLVVEAERRSYADRSFYLGDPDFVTIPTDALLSPTYLKSRMQSFTFEKATPSSEVSHGNVEVVESNETTHYSIVDAMGNAVSVTTTLNGSYGSKLYSNDLGFFFNNEMDDFSIKAGVPNMYGLVGSDKNSILPQKRMLSSMTPTIIEINGKLWMVLGTPGGSTIITSVLQTILNVYEFDMGAQQAVSQPRFHHQWLPDKVTMEPNRFSHKTIQQLRTKGYGIDEKNTPIISKVEVILVREDGTLEGGADPRGDDKALGY